MTNNKKTVGIFIMPREFPCGPQSSCCGPVGQSEEDMQKLKDSIKTQLGCDVEVISVTDGNQMKNNLQIVRLLRSFGLMSLPIISLNDEVVSMGNPSPEEAVLAIKEKITQV
jgi:disulfide oxidoreductase YuzD